MTRECGNGTKTVMSSLRRLNLSSLLRYGIVMPIGLGDKEHNDCKLSFQWYKILFY
ncbi:hypothetical protein [Candidatus Tisiphia endosymbiont of Hybos culiciformis]|uniref:hypothetical protein n=1 Tax=Candidatus Tisiphia endosymbiont of Hybos culiciformis TaxID=3139331 RepID=UPI003CCB3602